MKKIVLSVALMLVAKGLSAQLLYKISGNELEKPSYIVGIDNMVPAAMAQLINGMEEALNGSDQLYGELTIDAQTAEASQTVKEATTLNGKTIQQLLTADELKRFNAFLMKTQSQDLRNKMLAAKVEKKTPAALAKEMKVWLYLANNRGTFDPTSQMDNYFLRLAQKNKMPIYGLETLEEQTKARYPNTSLERQKEQMMCIIDNQSFYSQQMDNVMNAYMHQDLDGVEKALNTKLGGSCDPTVEEQQTAIWGRNAQWVEKMPDIMKTPTLFMVGVQHLPGQQGVLQLLRGKGYTVEGMR